MRCSRQLLPCRDENGVRRLPIDVLAGADPERTRPPTSILMLRPLVILVLTVELHAARPSPTRKRGVRYAALSELPVHEALLLHTGSASRALDRAYRIAYSGCACSDQHCRRCSLSRHLLCSLVHAADRASCTALSLGDGAAHAWGTPPYRTSLLFACYRVRERASDARVYRVVL